jgi:hypothetical protein
MAQQYCRGDFVTWDPKITTFPGIYYLGSAYAWASYLLLSWAGASLVGVSCCPGLSLPLLLALLRTKLQQYEPPHASPCRTGDQAL